MQINENDPVQKDETRGACHIPEKVHEGVTLSADSKKGDPNQSKEVMQVLCFKKVKFYNFILRTMHISESIVFKY